MKKLTDDELKKLNSYYESRMLLCSRLGEIEYNKTILEKEINNISTDISNLDIEFNKLSKDLHSKYGEGKIDYKTGEVEPIK